MSAIDKEIEAGLMAYIGSMTPAQFVTRMLNLDEFEAPNSKLGIAVARKFLAEGTVDLGSSELNIEAATKLFDLYTPQPKSVPKLKFGLNSLNTLNNEPPMRHLQNIKLVPPKEFDAEAFCKLIPTQESIGEVFPLPVMQLAQLSYNYDEIFKIVELFNFLFLEGCRFFGRAPNIDCRHTIYFLCGSGVYEGFEKAYEELYGFNNRFGDADCGASRSVGKLSFHFSKETPIKCKRIKIFEKPKHINITLNPSDVYIGLCGFNDGDQSNLLIFKARL